MQAGRPRKTVRTQPTTLQRNGNNLKNSPTKTPVTYNSRKSVPKTRGQIVRRSDEPTFKPVVRPQTSPVKPTGQKITVRTNRKDERRDAIERAVLDAAEMMEVPQRGPSQFETDDFRMSFCNDYMT